MASKLAAAKIASWSGVRTVIADAARDGVMVDACDGTPGVGTVVRPRAASLGARRLWIAFAVGSSGTVTVDECFLGFMPAFNARIFQPGNVGVISRSGSLATLMCQNITTAGFGIKAFLLILKYKDVCYYSPRQASIFPFDMPNEGLRSSFGFACSVAASCVTAGFSS